MTYRLLDTFRQTFDSKPYLHRRSTLGDAIAVEMFEDLLDLNRSAVLVQRMRDGSRVLNRANRRRGVVARRGDGTFGDLIPGVEPLAEKGFTVYRGPVATIEIGIEVKILAKAMIKQIDRVTSDLRKQAEHFRRRGGNPICVGIVGVNSASHYTSFEGDRSFPTDGKKYVHPADESADAIVRLTRDAAPDFDEFVILPFKATNESPFPFNWVDPHGTDLDYAASITRISSEYELRFR